MVEDRELFRTVETFSELSRVIEEVEEVRRVFGDHAMRVILSTLLLHSEPVGGERLYRMVREAGVDISRPAFYRKLKKLAKYGLVIPLGNPKGRRQGPYTVRPSIRRLFRDLAYQPGLLDKLEEKLVKDACRLGQALRDNDIMSALSGARELIEYFEAQGRLIFYIMLEELLETKNLLSSRGRNTLGKKAEKSLQGLHGLSEELVWEILVYGIARAILLTAPPYLIQIPLTALYKALIKEECMF